MKGTAATPKGFYPVIWYVVLLPLVVFPMFLVAVQELDLVRFRAQAIHIPCGAVPLSV